MFITNADQYALVEWDDYDAHSVVSVKQIASDVQEFQTGDVVDVREGISKHKPTIIASGMFTVRIHPCGGR